MHKCLNCEDSILELVPAEDSTDILTNPSDIKTNPVLPVEVDETLKDERDKVQQDIDNTEPPGGFHDLDGTTRPLPDDLPPPKVDHLPILEEIPNGSTISTISSSLENTQHFTNHFTILAISGVTALLLLACVSAGLYASRYVRKRILSSDMAWELLPMLEKHKPIYTDTDLNDVKFLVDKKGPILLIHAPPAPVSTLNSQGPGIETIGLTEMTDIPKPDPKEITDNFVVVEPQVPNTLFMEVDNPSEALDDLPCIVLDNLDVCPDPDFLPLPLLRSSTPPPVATPLTPPRTPVRRPLQMREASPLIPVSKPAWSIRATDAPPLGLSSAISTCPSVRSSPVPFTRSVPPSRPSSPYVSFHIPGELEPEYLTPEATSSNNNQSLIFELRERRAYRAPVPELDLAFAMQLRPGFGLGADSAWLVRFLMAMFGWMTVLIGGGSGRAERRTAASA